MLKKIMVIIFCNFISNFCFAENCPSISEIKANYFHGWSAYWNDEGTPLSESDLQEFRNTAAYFFAIRWLDGAPEGEGHCYYIQQGGVPTIAYLSKPDLVPDFSSSAWKYQGLEPRCHLSVEACALLDKKSVR